MGGTDPIITGEATVQRYMSNNRSYRMVTSAVTTTTTIHDNWQEGGDNQITGFGTHITGNGGATNGFDPTGTNNPSMFTVNYSATPIAFEAVSNTNVNTFEAGDPYLLFVRGDRIIDMTDPVYNPTETVLRAKGTLKYGTQAEIEYGTVNTGDFAMFGNPYQSAVDVNALFANGALNVNPVYYYVYDPTQATHGNWVSVNLLNATNTGTSQANQYVQPGQAAQFATEEPGESNLQFEEAFKAPSNFTTTNATGNRLSSDNMLTVQLFTTDHFNNGGPTHDSFGIIFGDGLDNEVTNADAKKPMNFYENLGIDNNGTYLSIERREMPQAEEVYPLYSSGYSHSDYTLKMIIEGLDETFLYLDDNFTGTSTLLEAGDTVYNFSVESNNDLSIATDRFSIRTEARLGVEDNNVLAGVRLYPNPLNDNTFYINAPKLDGETVTISVNDMLGREIFNTQQTFSGATVKIDLSQKLNSGIYMVNLSANGVDRTLRVIKR